MISRPLTLFLLLLTIPGLCQNLVPNPGFEEHYSGSSGYANIYLSKYWLSANPGTPDLYHSGLSSNHRTDQAPRSGNGFAGIIVLDRYADVLEYLQVQLLDTLKKNTRYRFEMYLALSASSPMAVSNVGACFSRERIKLSSWTRIKRLPQVMNPPGNVLSSAGEWVLIAGEFTASGGEKFMTIGNFTPDAEVNRKMIKDFFKDDILAYYFIDDISLTAVRKDLPADIPGKDTQPDTQAFRLRPVFFHYDRTTLLEESALYISQLAAYLAANPGIALEISGHTDNSGSDSYNQQLSDKRAEVILNYLIRQGISKKRLFRRAFSETRPASSNLSEKGRQLNRRVEFRIVKF